MDASKLGHVHAHLKHLTVDGDEVILPEKAYKNTAWLNSHGAKTVRILSEFLEPEQRFAACNVKNAILFFGSARSKSAEEHGAAVRRAQAILDDPATGDAEKAKQRVALERLRKTEWMCDVYTQVEALARKLTQWSMGRITSDGRVPYVISTGGGPGFMEAANKGAASVPGALSAGIAISLPFEAGLNKYVTPELGFQMHYFFSRKFALAWPSRALVVCAGGYGSLDECFEILTLLQCGKIEHPSLLPVVMFPGSYWKKIINWDAMVDAGVISESDVKMLYFTDDVDDATSYITGKLVQWEAATAAAAVAAAEAARRAPISAAGAAYNAAVMNASLGGIRRMPGDFEEAGASPVIAPDTIRFAKAHAPAPAVVTSPAVEPDGGAAAIRAPAPAADIAAVTGVDTPGESK